MAGLQVRETRHMLLNPKLLRANWNPTVCSVEGDPDPAVAGGDGGTPAADPIVEPPAVAAPTGFTQADIDKAAKEATDRAWGDARKKYQTKPATPVPPKTDDADKGNGVADLDAIRAEFDAKLKFKDLAIARGLSPQQAERLLPSFMAAAPEDGTAWLAKELEVWGMKPPDGADGANGKADDGKTDDGKVDLKLPGGPGPGKVDQSAPGLVDIFELSDEQIEQLGPSGLREHYEKVLKVADQRAGAPPLPAMMRTPKG